MKQLVVAVTCFALTTGCFTTTVRSGHAPAREAAYEQWHNGYVAGLIEGSGPYDLPQMCPEGWAEVTTSMQPLQTFLSVVTLFIYVPQTVSIICAAPGAPPVPPKSGYGASTKPYPEQPPAPLPVPPVAGPIPPSEPAKHD